MAKRSTAKRASAKRDTVRSRNATLYTKRETGGQFKEMDEKGRSQKADGRRKAKTRVRSGYGDQGDQTPRGSSRGTAASGAKRSAKRRSTAKGSIRTTARSRRGGSARAKTR